MLPWWFWPILIPTVVAITVLFSVWAANRRDGDDEVSQEWLAEKGYKDGQAGK